MSCDNLPDNGDVAKRMICAFARLRDPELADWMEAEVAFPNCMVDRITPVTAPEDIAGLAARLRRARRLAGGVRAVHPVGAGGPLRARAARRSRTPACRWSTDVVPYELMKLRLLNASHQALCYLGFLSGYRYAHEVCQDPLFARFLLSYMEHEGSPTLPEVPGVDLDAYRHQLVERFANPEVRDTLARLCAESSDRIPKWLVPVIKANLRDGGQVDLSALVVASWARYAEGVDEQGEPIEVVDRLKDRVMAAAAKQQDDPLAFVRDRDLFDDLADDERFATAYTAALDSLHRNGARATVEAHT